MLVCYVYVKGSLCCCCWFCFVVAAVAAELLTLQLCQNCNMNKRETTRLKKPGNMITSIPYYSWNQLLVEIENFCPGQGIVWCYFTAFISWKNVAYINSSTNTFNGEFFQTSYITEVRNSLFFIDHKVSLLRSQEPSTGPYP
jgi:hypothetical protein